MSEAGFLPYPLRSTVSRSGDPLSRRFCFFGLIVHYPPVASACLLFPLNHPCVFWNSGCCPSIPSSSTISRSLIVHLSCGLACINDVHSWANSFKDWYNEAGPAPRGQLAQVPNGMWGLDPLLSDQKNRLKRDLARLHSCLEVNFGFVALIQDGAYCTSLPIHHLPLYPETSNRQNVKFALAASRIPCRM